MEEEYRTGGKIGLSRVFQRAESAASATDSKANWNRTYLIRALV